MRNEEAPSPSVETEAIGPFVAEIHRVRTADGVPLVVTRLPSGGPDPHGTPVVFVYGTYSRRNFWVSPRGIGLAPFLAAQGYDCWVPDLRGHGLSPRTDRFRRFTAEDHMRRDLPAIQALVRAQTGRREFVVGHSAGGLYTYGALAAGWLQPDLRGLVVLGSQIAGGDRILKLPPVTWLLRLLVTVLGHFPAPRLGLGNEVEPPGELLEYIRWKGLGGRWETQDGRPYAEGLRNVTAPLLAFAAPNDRNDPPEGCRAIFEQTAASDREFVLLARAEGFSTDYDHVGMVVSKAAQAEVWPRIAAWLDARRGGAP